MAKKSAYPNPYPNEHAARLRAPRKSRFLRYRSLSFGDERNTFPVGIRPIFGVLRKKSKTGAKVEVQALRFDAKKWSVKRAKAWLKRQGYKPILFEPASGGKKAKKNPALMVISNPKAKGKPSAQAVKTYKQFHMSDPENVEVVTVPKGWPKNLIAIGSVDRLDVQNSSGREFSRKYNGQSVMVCMTPARNELFIVGKNKLGLKSGIAMRIDYTVPKTSGRNKWSGKWWHPHDSGPRFTMDKSGKAARVKGPKLKINVRGIIG